MPNPLLKFIRVRIKSAVNPNVWYADAIGDIVEVVEWDGSNYKLVIKNVLSRAIFLIHKEDVTLL